MAKQAFEIETGSDGRILSFRHVAMKDAASLDDQRRASVKHDCPEYEKCLSEFGDNLGWSCSNCGFDPEAPKDNEMVITCELRLNLVKAGRNIAKLFE